MWVKAKTILKIMNKILSYLTIAGLLVFSGFAGYYIFFNKPEQSKKTYQFVTRSAVDSLKMQAYVENLPTKAESNSVPWNTITSAIVALAIAGGNVWLKKFKSEIYCEIKNIRNQLQILTDQENRKSVDTKLLKLEQDAAGWADDEKLKALIEGIGSRTRSFCRDIMTMDFDAECLENAMLKMNARIIDNKHQIKDLGFSDYFQTEFTKIRCNVTGQLRTDLTRLMQDKLHNSKYERFGEIITRFLHTYLKATIKLGNETKQ